MASDADTDRRILAYLDGNNTSAARPMTDEAIARALKLDLGCVRKRLRWLESLENGAQVWRDGQDFWTDAKRRR
jgi:DNA-binding Lrp family transcriptional regulator